MGADNLLLPPRETTLIDPLPLIQVIPGDVTNPTQFDRIKTLNSQLGFTTQLIAWTEKWNELLTDKSSITVEMAKALEEQVDVIVSVGQDIGHFPAAPFVDKLNQLQAISPYSSALSAFHDDSILTRKPAATITVGTNKEVEDVAIQMQLQQATIFRKISYARLAARSLQIHNRDTEPETLIRSEGTLRLSLKDAPDDIRFSLDQLVNKDSQNSFKRPRKIPANFAQTLVVRKAEFYDNTRDDSGAGFDEITFSPLNGFKEGVSSVSPAIITAVADICLHDALSRYDRREQTGDSPARTMHIEVDSPFRGISFSFRDTAGYRCDEIDPSQLNTIEPMLETLGEWVKITDEGVGQSKGIKVSVYIPPSL